MAEAIHSSTSVEEALYHKAVIAELEGDAEGASTQLAACVAMCTASKEQIKLERALRGLHRVHETLGNDVAASKYLAQAEAILERLGLPALRAFLLSRKVAVVYPGKQQ